MVTSPYLERLIQTILLCIFPIQDDIKNVVYVRSYHQSTPGYKCTNSLRSVGNLIDIILKVIPTRENSVDC